MTYNAGICSAIAGNIAEDIAADFHETSKSQFTLATGLIVLGFGIGPIVWAPLSERIGRRIILTLTFGTYCLFNMGCALATSWSSFLIFRFLCGTMVSSVSSVINGAIADIFHDVRSRGKAVTLYMAVWLTNVSSSTVTMLIGLSTQATVMGPVIGPSISAYLEIHRWRWSFWALTILGAITFVPALFIPGNNTESNSWLVSMKTNSD